MTTISQIMAALQDRLGVLTGINQAPDYPPEQLNMFPIIVVYPGEGLVTYGDPVGQYKNLETVVIELHIQRTDLPLASEHSYSFHHTILNALFTDVSLGALIDTMREDVSWTWGEMGWGGVITLGFRYRVPIKYHTTLS